MIDTSNKTFRVHMAMRKLKKIPMHLEKQAQVGALLFNKASIKIPVKYLDYINVFSAENIAKFLENSRINEHIIELEKGTQPPF